MKLLEKISLNPMEKDSHGCMPNGIGPAKTLWCEAVNMCVSPDHYDSKGCESLIILIFIGIILYIYFSKTTKFL